MEEAEYVTIVQAVRQWMPEKEAQLDSILQGRTCLLVEAN